MLFIINKVEEPVSLTIVKQEDKSRTALQIASGDMKFDLFWATDEGLIEAFTKRFKVGTTNIKNLVNRHDFYVTDRLTVVNRPKVEGDVLSLCHGIPLTTVPIDLNQRTDEEKSMPRHVIVVVSKDEDSIQAQMNDERNVLESASFVEDGYRFQVFTIKWSSWKALKHKAALYITDKDGKEQGLELGVTPTGKGNRVQDDLIVLTDEELVKFKEEQAELKKAEEEAAARKKEAATNRPKYDRNFNNQSRSQGQRPQGNGTSKPYAKKGKTNQYGGGYNGGNRPFKDFFDSRDDRSGNRGRKNFGKGNRKHR